MSQPRVFLPRLSGASTSDDAGLDHSGPASPTEAAITALNALQRNSPSTASAASLGGPEALKTWIQTELSTVSFDVATAWGQPVWQLFTFLVESVEGGSPEAAEVALSEDREDRPPRDAPRSGLALRVLLEGLLLLLQRLLLGDNTKDTKNPSTTSSYPSLARSAGELLEKITRRCSEVSLDSRHCAAGLDAALLLLGRCPEHRPLVAKLSEVWFRAWVGPGPSTGNAGAPERRDCAKEVGERCLWLAAEAESEGSRPLQNLSWRFLKNLAALPFEGEDRQSRHPCSNSFLRSIVELSAKSASDALCTAVGRTEAGVSHSDTSSLIEDLNLAKFHTANLLRLEREVPGLRPLFPVYAVLRHALPMQHKASRSQPPLRDLGSKIFQIALGQWASIQSKHAEHPELSRILQNAPCLAALVTETLTLLVEDRRPPFFTGDGTPTAASGQLANRLLDLIAEAGDAGIWNPSAEEVKLVCELYVVAVPRIRGRLLQWIFSSTPTEYSFALRCCAVLPHALGPGPTMSLAQTLLEQLCAMAPSADQSSRARDCFGRGQLQAATCISALLAGCPPAKAVPWIENALAPILFSEAEEKVLPPQVLWALCRRLFVALSSAQPATTTQQQQQQQQRQQQQQHKQPAAKAQGFILSSVAQRLCELCSQETALLERPEAAKQELRAVATALRCGFWGKLPDAGLDGSGGRVNSNNSYCSNSSSSSSSNSCSNSNSNSDEEAARRLALALRRYLRPQELSDATRAAAWTAHGEACRHAGLSDDLVVATKYAVQHLAQSDASGVQVAAFLEKVPAEALKSDAAVLILEGLCSHSWLLRASGLSLAAAVTSRPILKAGARDPTSQSDRLCRSAEAALESFREVYGWEGSWAALDLKQSRKRPAASPTSASDAPSDASDGDQDGHGGAAKRRKRLHSTLTKLSDLLDPTAVDEACLALAGPEQELCRKVQQRLDRLLQRAN